MTYVPKVGDRVVLRGKIINIVGSSCVIERQCNTRKENVAALCYGIELDESRSRLEVGQRVRLVSTNYCFGEIMAIKGDVAFVDWEGDDYAKETGIRNKIELRELIPA